MTNTTGPAQQQGQPTQLSADEARELDRLVNRLSSAEWESGFQDGTSVFQYGDEGKTAQTKRAEAKKARDDAYEAIKAWVFTHAPSPELSWREVTG